MTLLKNPGITSPLPTVKSVRPDDWKGLTSADPGVIVPVAFFPLLREDRIRGSLVVQVKSDETLHVIVNPVRVRAQAYLIPKTALARFHGSMEALNRSYENEPAPAGMGTTPPWFMEDPNVGAKNDTGYEVFDKLGIHYGGGHAYNSDLIESYNVLVNWMRQNVSAGLALRTDMDPTLAPAFWDNWRFDHIKPSFDREGMEGPVPVYADGTGKIPVYGIRGLETDDITGNLKGRDGTTVASGASHRAAVVDIGTYDYNKPGDTGPYVQIGDISPVATFSVAQIDAVRKSQYFAKMRDRYKSVPDEYLIDMLMQGISIPDADLRQPILIGSSEAIIGQTERYATDGASLDQSVSNGVAQLSMTINTPAVNTGGIVLVVVSIVPEQLYERVRDLSLNYSSGTRHDVNTPEYVKDYLDAQKVEVVPNEYADILHTVPDGIFGYAPLNHEWRRSFSRVGGRFKRPVPDAFVEDRQRIWAVEVEDPTLSDDFYLCPKPFPKTVFADALSEPYEIITVGRCRIVGSTVFGDGFEEDNESFERIFDNRDTTGYLGDGSDIPHDMDNVTGPVAANEDGTE